MPRGGGRGPREGQAAAPFSLFAATDDFPVGLTYIKGASTDSGIDTAPCMPAAVLGPVHLAGSRSLVHGRAEQWADSAECHSH